MGQEGWISIRNVPKVKPKDKMSIGVFYLKILFRFFQKHKVCSNCKGHGYIVKKRRPLKELAMIKYKGIEQLEKLKKVKGIQISDIIREIFSYELENREVCKTCSGKRFVSIKKSKK